MNIFGIIKITIVGLLLTAVLPVKSQTNEKMEYLLRYGLVHGGKVELRTGDSVYQKRPLLHQYMRMKTIGLADKLYKVDDIYESLMDPKTMKPVKAVRNIKERKYRYYNEVVFDQKSDTISSQRAGKKVVPKNMVDILGLLFYMRQPNFFNKLKLDKVIEMPIVHDDELMTIKVNYLGTEKIKTVLGEVECFIIAPVIQKGKVLKRDDGLKFFITTDAKKLPVCMEFDLMVGAVKCELQEYAVNGISQVKK